MDKAPLVRKPDLGAQGEREPGMAGSGGAPRRPNMPPSRQPRRSFWKQFWKWTGVFSLVSIAALIFYFKFTAHGRATGSMIQDFVPSVIEAKRNPGLIFDKSGSDIVNILLIGRDVNWKIGKVLDPTTGKMRSYQVYDEKAPARSDTMIIMSLDRKRKTIHMISLPRDAWVHMPPNKYDVRNAKLNAAHAYGGPELLERAIEEDLGITIHHYAVIRFEGFKRLIDQVHGVKVDVIGALHRNGSRGDLNYDDNWGNLHIHLKPGPQTLNGEQAHNYVRFRMDIEGDPGRIKRQQQVMRALAKKLGTLQWYELPPIVQEIRRQFKSDMDNSGLASAAEFTKGVGDSSKIQPLTLFGIYASRGRLILNKSKNEKLLSYVFGSTFNPSVFLENSQSTERDEMGEENNSSPGAKEILRRAGILHDRPPLHADADADTSSSADSAASTPLSVDDSSSSDSDSSSHVTDSSTSDASSDADSEAETSRRSNRRSRERKARSEEASSADASSARSTPREEPTEAPSVEKPRKRKRHELSVDDTPKPVRRSTRSRSGDESDSPVPVGDGQDTGESPVPRAE